MTCAKIKPCLGPYVDEEAPAEVRSAVEVHVAACAICRAELVDWRSLADRLARSESPAVPAELWGAIARRLDAAGSPAVKLRNMLLSRHAFAIAASVALAVGLGLFAIPWAGDGIATVEAATVDFGRLLDQMRVDPQAAFERFLSDYEGRPIPPAEARRHAPRLSFDLPAVLPGGFGFEAAYALRFGDSPGIAARYSRGTEFLAVVFHTPVLREQYGTHQDYQCIVGQHRGHRVAVGEWTLVHLTDPSTCHCVLSRLDETTTLPAILSAIAPAARQPGS